MKDEAKRSVEPAPDAEYVHVPGFGRCAVVRRLPFASVTSQSILEVLTPAGTKLPVVESLVKRDA